MRYTKLLQDIKNYYIKGNNKYPIDMEEAYNTLNNYARAAQQRQNYCNNS